MRIHDRYILGGFWRNLLLGILAFTVIYVTVDLSEESDNFYDSKATAREVVSYYFYQLPFFNHFLSPFTFLQN